MDITNLISGKAKVEEKKLIEFIKPVDPTIKSKLQRIQAGKTNFFFRDYPNKLYRISLKFQEAFTNIKFGKFNQRTYITFR